MNINNTLKNIIKKLMKVVLILLILIGTGLAGYASWFSIEKEKKIKFFTEETPNFFKDIEWSPTRNFWQSLDDGNLDKYGEEQEGYDSKGRLVFRHVLLNQDIPIVAYYFSGPSSAATDYSHIILQWVIECDPKKILTEENGRDRSDLTCSSSGKYVSTVLTYFHSDSRPIPKVEIGGFSYWTIEWRLDKKKMKRNKALKGSILD